MPLAKCPRCEKLFSRGELKVCTACWPAEEADYEKVRDVIAQHKDLPTADVAKMAEVKLEVVNRMVEDGIITAVVASGTLDASCGMCGAPAISLSKKLCQGCLDKLNRQVAQAQSQLRTAPLQKRNFESNLSTHEVFDQKRR